MPDENKSKRLKSVATEFNVGIQNIVDLLSKKGHNISSNPNSRLTTEEYDIVIKNFSNDRKTKQNADKISISTSATVADANKKEAVKKAQEEEQYVTIHNAPIYTIASDKKRSAVEPKETTEKSAPVDEKETPVQEVVKEEALKIEKAEPKDSVEVKESQPQVESAGTPATEKSSLADDKEQQSSVENSPLPVQQPVAAQDTTVQPAQDSTSDKGVESAPRIEEETSKETKGANDVASSIAMAVPPISISVIRKIELDEHGNPKVPIPSGKTVSVAIKPATNESDAAQASKTKEKEVEFIPTQYQKIEGPKVTGKIDLGQFEKPKTEPRREKRKRLEKKVERVDETKFTQTQETQQSSNNEGGFRQSRGGQSQQQQQQQQSRQQSQKQKKNGKNSKRVVVDEEEVEKQMHDTLNRLGPKGKSNTSKHNRDKRQKAREREEEERARLDESKHTLEVTEFVTASELATMMGIPVTKLIATCFSVGNAVTINQRLDAELIQLIASEYNFEIKFASEDVVNTLEEEEGKDNPEDLVPRNPIVTVMGHVDHGKTSLLDYIRKTNVIAGEAGGITQHIGAYEVETKQGHHITFLDTPGHEAFTAMRARGAKVTDVAIIVVAADDRVMPQTVEAIQHAQAAGVPIIFAINKIDKPGADPDRIKTELAAMNLLVEEWGGKYQSQDISAKKGINVEELLEKVILEAEIMELKGNPTKRAKGTVLESALDKGRGYVAKILIQDGSIRKGDPVLAGSTYGRVRAMYNERNQEVLEAGPSQPVLLIGLNGACQAGDTFNVVEDEHKAKELASRRTQLQREQDLRTQTHVTLDDIGRRIALGNFKELNIIVKGDVDGSVEALSDSLLRLSTEEVKVNVILKGVGQINENDVRLAESSDALIIGFQVRPSVQARRIAETQKIDIRLYSIIYDAINEIKDAIEGMLAPEKQEKIVANLEIRETFRISKVGTIAGCMCTEGKINRQHNVRIIRDGIVVYTGKLASLKRFKDDVKEVVSGQDCGLNIENFNDIKVGDIVEAYEVIEVKRKL